MLPALQNKYLQIVAPGAIVDNAAFTTNEIDTAGWDYCTILMSFGAMDIAMAALKLQESDTSGSNFADVTGGVYGTSTNSAGSTSTLPSATSDNTLVAFHVNLKGRKRYLDVSATGGDGTSGTYLSATAVLSRGEIGASTAATRGCAQELIL